MKFVASKDAPDIPLEILEAQESDELVFFCGAGVSYPSGLPDFDKLVDDVYVALNEKPDNLEKEAIESHFYDRALGLLESRLQGKSQTLNHQVRKEIIKRLSISNAADLSTHRALLELSKTKNDRYRLVTTNVDHCFLNTNLVSWKHIDAASKLPISKPHKWESIVHLHGIIDESQDAEGINLVFTSGDFGSAFN
ncbi:MAG: hypothetical protein JKY19_14530 [Alcanivoracaceae bacterium]|nr:hypothetical protein [Alcanivoracaceae bacterium]